MTRRRGPAEIELSDRDERIVRSVFVHKLLSSQQIERLFFRTSDQTSAPHVSALAASRRCRAVLKRLSDLGLLQRVERRVGGHRSGSSGYVYRITTGGLRAIGIGGRGVRPEPSPQFWRHQLMTAEISVGLQEAVFGGEIRELVITHEPENWRRFLGKGAAMETLKPDLVAGFLTKDGWQVRWFVEVDRDTEHLPVILRKSEQYQRYWRSGTEDNPIFPRVLWSVPDSKRVVAIETAIQRHRQLHEDLFRVATHAESIRTMTGDG